MICLKILGVELLYLKYSDTFGFELFQIVGSGFLVFLFTFFIEYRRRKKEEENLRILLCSELRKCCTLLSCSLNFPPDKTYSNFNIEKIEITYQKLIPFISSKKCQQLEDIIDDLRYLQNEDLKLFNDIVLDTIDKIEVLYKQLKSRNMPKINYKNIERITRLIKKIYRN
ncbi:MAG: hypothetical protein KH045_10880 [Megamonas funiformis]|jgi:hypothetical protein|uniref:hypothetical protein n=1 Tax=Megamonas funiformis TaxID=437897 RepID=UPI001EBACF37|nr:hypothetical protein [Megamonas funiformis]MBS7213027.1 hypothetical protein [Megamonas funiformis]UWF97043.1 MAG: hypothetical protein [Bacteriophage sp.]